MEVKSFSGKSFIKDFQQAIGQYRIYRDVIELTNFGYELYLAIGTSTYQDFFRQPEIEALLERNQVNLLVIHLEHEEIVKWIN